MLKTIRVTIKGDKVTSETVGFTGSACQDASEFIDSLMADDGTKKVKHKVEWSTPEEGMKVPAELKI